MAKEPEIPGVVLHLEGSSVHACVSSAQQKAVGTLRLTASISDLAVWDAVVKKVDGMPIYSVETLASQLVLAAQRRADSASSAAAQTVEAARVRIDQLEAQLAFRQQELEQLRACIALQDSELRAHRQLSEALRVAASPRQ